MKRQRSKTAGGELGFAPRRADRRMTDSAPPEKRDVAGILARHDPSVANPKFIREALKRMAKVGPEHWLYEAEFSREAGVGLAIISRYRDGFDSHIVVVPGRDGRPKNAWFATPSVAAKVRAQLRKSIPNYDDRS